MTQNEAIDLLRTIVHPETGENIADSGIASVSVSETGKISVALSFPKTRDPFAAKIKQQAETILSQAAGEAVTVFIREAAPKKPLEPKDYTATTGIGKVIAVASGKGGVGKSTVTSNLALAMRNAGYKVGILDADIYGPSQPKMFGIEGYLPEAFTRDGRDYIVPAGAMGIKIMSIGFFIKPTDALLWRGAMATNALRQLIHQTDWGDLDFLFADLPPGTGDVHLSLISELRVDGAVIVTTPQQVAVADVRRGIEMFRHENVAIPVLGLVENMAWFTPAELPDNRYYIFGRDGGKRLAEENDVELLGQIPIIQSISEGGDNGMPATGFDSRIEQYYRDISSKIVEKLL